jgi:hypothetical protein
VQGVLFGVAQGMEAKKTGFCGVKSFELVSVELSGGDEKVVGVMLKVFGRGL